MGTAVFFLGWQDNLPSPLPSQLQTFKLFPVEIKYGLLQVKKSSGVHIIHRERKRRGKAYLRCTQPTSLLINRVVGCVHHDMFVYVTKTVHLYI